MSFPFPLLRLPRLVLYEVFKLLSIGEKVKLSLCTKKISTQINNCRLYSQKVMVSLDMLYQGIRVYSENNNDRFGIFNRYNSATINNPDMQQYQIEGRTVPVISFPRRIETFWKNHQEGFLSVIQHILKLFQCKISTSDGCHGSYFFQPTILKLFDLQLEFKKLTIRLNGLKYQNVLWKQISNKLGLVKDLKIISAAYPGFTPVFTSWPQKISIRSSDWFTVETLLTCPCFFINLNGSLSRHNDLDAILRKWKTGGFPNLERLEIRSQNYTNDGAMILGMNLMELRGQVIQTDDGSKKATFRADSRSIEMSVTSFV